MEAFIEVLHLPTGQKFEMEVIPENLEDVKEICALVSEGGCSHLKLTNGRETIYFNNDILKDCVLKIITTEE